MLVIVVSSFAALGCMAVLLTAYFQWRAVNRSTSLSSALSVQNGLGPFRAMAAPWKPATIPWRNKGQSSPSGAHLLAGGHRAARKAHPGSGARVPPGAGQCRRGQQHPRFAAWGGGDPGNVRGIPHPRRRRPPRSAQGRGNKFYLSRGRSLDEALAAFDEAFAARPQMPRA